VCVCTATKLITLRI